MGRRAVRSYAPLTREHLQRLARVAAADCERFVETRPEYAGRYLGTVLAQGAALHWVECQEGVPEKRRHGVKDLDLWSYFAAIPDGAGGFVRFPADKRHTTADSEFSDLGRQAYDWDLADNAYTRGRYRTWETYTGRRVDLLVRSSPVPLGTPLAAAVAAWLATGTISARRLAERPIVGVAPLRWRGRVLHSVTR